MREVRASPSLRWLDSELAVPLARLVHDELELYGTDGTDGTERLTNEELDRGRIHA